MHKFQNGKQTVASTSRSAATNTGTNGIAVAPPAQTKQNYISGEPPFLLKGKEQVVQRVLKIGDTTYESITPEFIKELTLDKSFIFFMRSHALTFVPFLEKTVRQYFDENKEMTRSELVHNITRAFLDEESKEEHVETNENSVEKLTLFGKYMPPEFITKGSLTTSNATALDSHLQENPTIFDKVLFHHHQEDLLNITFNGDQHTKAFGGAYYSPERKDIHSERDLNNAPSSKFVQLIMHELGHATFQKYLEGATKIKELEEQKKKLLERYALAQEKNDSLGTQKNPYGGTTDLEGQSNTNRRRAVKITGGSQHLQSKDPLTEMEEIMSEVKKINNLLAYYEKGSKAKVDIDYYHRLLSEFGSKYFFGTEIDKNNLFNAEARKKYQLNPNEFYAESFMHISYHETKLIAFVEELQGTEGVPETVKDAWQKILAILLEYKSTSVIM